MAQPLQSHETTDDVLMARTGTGDRDAFAELFRRHQRTVFRFALQMTGSPDVAEDITQDVFLALAKGSTRYTPDAGALSTYLYGIARHLVLQREKRWRPKSEVSVATLDEQKAVVSLGDPVERIAQAEQMAALRQAILRLPAHYREVVVLCELNGLAYGEAARVVGCPVGTVRSRLNRARRLLLERCRAFARSESVQVGSAGPWRVSGRPRIAGSGAE